VQVERRSPAGRLVIVVCHHTSLARDRAESRRFSSVAARTLHAEQKRPALRTAGIED
jgi:hypothetical protein